MLGTLDLQDSLFKIENSCSVLRIVLEHLALELGSVHTNSFLEPSSSSWHKTYPFWTGHLLLPCSTAQQKRTVVNTHAKLVVHLDQDTLMVWNSPAPHCIWTFEKLQARNQRSPPESIRRVDVQHLGQRKNSKDDKSSYMQHNAGESGTWSMSPWIRNVCQMPYGELIYSNDFRAFTAYLYYRSKPVELFAGNPEN